MDNMLDFFKEHAQGDILPLKAQVKASEIFSLSFKEIEEAILERGYLPGRYQRNRNTITIEQQLILFRSTAAIIGCGGLGGYVIEELARLGIGTLILVDPDSYEEHNLNRQLHSSIENLGRSKVRVSAEHVAEINPAVTSVSQKKTFSKKNGKEILGRANVVVDALDSITTRLALSEICSELNLPLVHGSIAGWYGQVLTQLPGENSLKAIYKNTNKDKGIEQETGNPSFTPAFVASIEAAEVCKLLLNMGKLLQNRLINIDLLNMDFYELKI